jgi:hypothetical protein
MITHADVDEYCDALDAAMAANPNDFPLPDVARARKEVVRLRTSLHKVVDEP